MHAKCVRLIGNERKTREFDVKSKSALTEILQVDDTRTRHVVIIDGWKIDTCPGLTAACMSWFVGRTDQRRLSFICLLSSRGKMEPDVERLACSREFTVYSWTLNEYKAAVQDDGFFASVSANLEKFPRKVSMGDTSPINRDSMVEAKFYYAGGSCRHMFFDPIEVVEQDIRVAVDSVKTASRITEAGDRSYETINRLFTKFPLQDSGNTVTPLVSEYVVTEIALKCQVEAIRSFMATQQYYSNPVLDGWMFALLFFASLRNESLKLTNKSGIPLVPNWPVSREAIKHGLPTRIPRETIWIKPNLWNHDGYDVVMVCKKEGHVLFVQVTSARQHDLKLIYLSEFLKKLKRVDPHFKVKKVEIHFVVDHVKLPSFRIGTVADQGILSGYGWKKGKESRRVKLFGIRGL